MALGLYGDYTFEKPEWMKDKAFNNFITESEFNNSEYEEIINQLFEKAEKTKHNNSYN